VAIPRRLRNLDVSGYFAFGCAGFAGDFGVADLGCGFAGTGLGIAFGVAGFAVSAGLGRAVSLMAWGMADVVSVFTASGAIIAATEALVTDESACTTSARFVPQLTSIVPSTIAFTVAEILLIIEL
jgi:hypothetical protein